MKTWGLVPWKIQLALAGPPLHDGAGAASADHLHVSAWRVSSHHRQHVVSLDLRRECGGSARPAEYLIFYFICGIGSGIAQVLFTWGSHVPSIGASGAISGVLGAYFVFFPRSQILTLVPLFIIFFTWKIPAVVFIGLWFAMQFLSGLGSLGGASTGGVAVWAHIGGFLLGALIAGSAKLLGRAAVRSY